MCLRFNKLVIIYYQEVFIYHKILFSGLNAAIQIPKVGRVVNFKLHDQDVQCTFTVSIWLETTSRLSSHFAHAISPFMEKKKLCICLRPTGYAVIHHSKYWMTSIMTQSKMGKTKNSSFILSISVTFGHTIISNPPFTNWK